jgi:hypothetical protein
MARSSAAKKVAKAASTGAGGAKAQTERNFLFPMAMVLISILGVALIFVARDRRADNSPQGAPRIGADHWHVAYQIYVCDSVNPTVYPEDSVEDLTGIHSHGDGLFHIHPFVTTVSGQFAVVGAFMKEGGWELTDSTLELPNGTILDELDFTCGEGDEAVDAEFRILKWNTLDAETPLVFTEDLENVRLNENGQLFTFAWVDPSMDDDDIPRPDDAFLRQYLGLDDQPLSEILEDGSTHGTTLDDDDLSDSETDTANVAGTVTTTETGA